MKTRLLAAGLLAVLIAGCASWRWSGSSPKVPPAENPSTPEQHVMVVSKAPRDVPPRIPVPPAPPERFRTALFYSDLGPDQIDVSGYPTQQRYNYGVYARVCSRCHTLARSINAPVVGRGWWEFYLMGMRVRSRLQGAALDRNEVKEILDFLEYDSRARKIDGRREFDRLTEELQSRFDASVAERMKALQQANPSPLSPPEP